MTELLRTLRLRDLALLIVGAVIGSGIFLVPAQVLRQIHGSTGRMAGRRRADAPGRPDLRRTGFVKLIPQVR